MIGSGAGRALVRSRTLVLSTLATLATIALAGCGEDGASDAVGSDETVWPLEVAHEIGSLEDEDQSLTRIGEVLIGPERELYVAQSDDRNIRVYTADGALRQIVGREGQGPGELSGATIMGLHGDSLWVLDGELQRVTWFSLNGELLGTHPWSADHDFTGAVAHTLLPPVAMRAQSDGTFLALPLTLIVSSQRASVDPALINTPMLLLSSSGALLDTVVVADLTAKDQVPEGQRLLFPAHPFYRLDGAGEGVVFAERITTGNPDPGTFRVGRVLMNGDTLFDRAFRYDPVPVPADALENALEGLTPERQQRLREMTRPQESLPGLSDMVVTADLIWLAREDEGQDSVAWWALDPGSGDHIGTIHLPPGQEIVAGEGDLLVTKRTDELDVPYLVRYRVGR